MIATIDAVSVALLVGNRMLLVRRGQPPSQGQYAFPGGRVEEGETDEAAARRELMEETGIVAGALSPLREVMLHSERAGQPVRYRLRVFFGRAEAAAPRAASDAAEAALFELEQIERLPVTGSTLEIVRELLAGTPA
jgi:ADP-ribose pyrophosphatase YjhB (NUDIX family)